MIINGFSNIHFVPNIENIGQFKCDIFDKLTSNYPKAKVQIIIILCVKTPMDNLFKLVKNLLISRNNILYAEKIDVSKLYNLYYTIKYIIITNNIYIYLLYIY